MDAIASQITSLTIVYSNVYSDADQRKHQSSVSLAFVRVIHRWPVNSPHKWPVMRKMFPFDDIAMQGREEHPHFTYQLPSYWWLSIVMSHSIIGIDMVLPERSSLSRLSSNNIIFCFNILRPRQNGRCFPDDIFKCIFLNENRWISIKISLKFVPEGPINNIPALFQIMAWRRPGDRPLSKPMVVCLLTHICVTRPQWDNSLWPSNTIWGHRSISTLTQVMAYCLMAASYCQNQCWLLISKVLWHSSECINIGRPEDTS